MKQHSTKVFRDIVNALGSFIQSLFIVPNTGNPAATNAPAGEDHTEHTEKELMLSLLVLQLETVVGKKVKKRNP